MDAIEYIVFLNRWDNIRPYVTDATLEGKAGEEYIHGKTMLVYIDTAVFSNRKKYNAIGDFFNRHPELFDIIPGTREVKKMQDKRFIVSGDDSCYNIKVLKLIIDRYFQDVGMANRCCVEMKEYAVVANVFFDGDDRSKLLANADYVNCATKKTAACLIS